jgi:hypothetical protein
LSVYQHFSQHNPIADNQAINITVCKNKKVITKEKQKDIWGFSRAGSIEARFRLHGAGEDDTCLIFLRAPIYQAAR